MPSARRRLTPTILSVLACSLLSTSNAPAVCLEPDPKVCFEFFLSDAVFAGTVISEESVEPTSHFVDGGRSYRLRVHTVFRGPDESSIEVFTENNSGRLVLEVGQEYLLFATKRHDRFRIGGCGNSGVLADAGSRIREIEQLGPGSPTFIEGQVVLRGTGSTGLPDLRVVATGGGGAYWANTDQDGWFRVSVAPG